MRRRGTITISLTTLLESLVVVFLLVILLIFGLKIYQVFFAPDQTSLNTYKLIGDNLNSLLASPDPTPHLSFRFTFDFKQTVTNELDHSVSNGFKGTIFGVSSDGTLSAPFPATVTGAGQRTFAGLPVARKDINKACATTACLCFSKTSLTKDATPDAEIALLKNPYTCRSFDVKGGIAFDFTQKDLTFNQGQYAEVLVKKSGANPVTVAISLANNQVDNGAPTPPALGGGASGGAGASSTT